MVLEMEGVVVEMGGCDGTGDGGCGSGDGRV